MINIILVFSFQGDLAWKSVQTQVCDQQQKKRFAAILYQRLMAFFSFRSLLVWNKAKTASVDRNHFLRAYRCRPQNIVATLCVHGRAKISTWHSNDFPIIELLTRKQRLTLTTPHVPRSSANFMFVYTCLNV